MVFVNGKIPSRNGWELGGTPLWKPPHTALLKTISLPRGPHLENSPTKTGFEWHFGTKSGRWLMLMVIFFDKRHCPEKCWQIHQWKFKNIVLMETSMWSLSQSKQFPYPLENHQLSPWTWVIYAILRHLRINFQSIFIPHVHLESAWTMSMFPVVLAVYLRILKNHENSTIVNLHSYQYHSIQLFCYHIPFHNSCYSYYLSKIDHMISHDRLHQ